MQFVDGSPIFSPSDLVSHLACEHLTQLNRLAAAGELARPTDDRSEVQLIRDLGDKHELHYLHALRDQGLSVVEIADAKSSSELATRHSETVEAMRSGAAVVAVGESWLRGPNRRAFPAIHDLLVRCTPRTRSGAALRQPGESASDAVVRVAADLDDSYLAVQGPPGTGKTYKLRLG